MQRNTGVLLGVDVWRGGVGSGGWGRCMDVKVYDENRDNSDSENRDNCT